jgi:predicted RNase H-like HicB family nuclease
MIREYKIEIERDGRWWMVHIPELDGLTQARRLGEAEQMAREWIAVSTGTPIKDITVHIVSITVDGINMLGEARHVNDLRTEAADAEREALAAASDYARHLTHAGIPVRDIAALIDVSPQRISQLANEKTPAR